MALAWVILSICPSSRPRNVSMSVSGALGHVVVIVTAPSKLEPKPLEQPVAETSAMTAVRA